MASSTYQMRKKMGLCTRCGGIRDSKALECRPCRIKESRRHSAWAAQVFKDHPERELEIIQFTKHGLLEAPKPPPEKPAHRFGRRWDGLEHLRSTNQD